MLYIEKLSEKNLLEVLREVFPLGLITAQKRINVYGKIMIIDYEVIHNNRLHYVEFDGPTHYTSAKTQFRDDNLKLYCEFNNIYLVRLPYFIQPDNYFLSREFNLPSTYTYDVSTKYLNGFIDSKITLPGDFNTYGWNLFISQCEEYKKYDLDGGTTRVQEIKDSLFSRECPEVIFGLDYHNTRSKLDFIHK